MSNFEFAFLRNQVANPQSATSVGEHVPVKLLAQDIAFP
jgi:hypothetical protein